MKPRGPLTTVLTLLLNRFESLNLWTPLHTKIQWISSQWIGLITDLQSVSILIHPYFKKNQILEWMIAYSFDILFKSFLILYRIAARLWLESCFEQERICTLKLFFTKLYTMCIVANHRLFLHSIALFLWNRIKQ